MNKNYAEFFPILMYKDGKLTRVNGSGNIVGGDYALLPLFSTTQKHYCSISVMQASINQSTAGIKCKSLEIDCNICRNDLPPEPCFLVARRHGYAYTAEEVDTLNKIWEQLMKENNLI